MAGSSEPETPADESDADGAALWAAVSAFSDAELQITRRSIRQFHCADKTDKTELQATGSTASVALQLGGGPQRVRVRVDDFVHVFLAFLHVQVQLHTDTQVTKGEEAAQGQDDAFELHQEEFPQLGSDINKAAMRTEAGAQRAIKPIKRRITTTLLTPKDSTVVARPVPAAIEFPPLGASETTQSAWMKQSLLERRMGAATPVQAWGLKEKKKGSVWGGSQDKVATNTPPVVKAKTVVMQVATKTTGGNRVQKQVWGPKATVKGSTVWGNQLNVATNSSTVVKAEAAIMRITPKKIDSDATQSRQMLVKKTSSNQVVDSQQDVQPTSNSGLTTNQELDEPIATSKEDVSDSNQTEHQVDSGAADVKVNRQAAKLYGFLIKERFVSSTSAELQVLISLLYRSDCAKCSRGGGVQSEKATDNDNNAPEARASSCETPSEFCWRVNCLEFAEIVLHEIEEIIVHLGSNLLGLVKQSLRDAGKVCTAMLERLEQVSQQREELRVAESARIGCQLPIEMKASAAAQDFTIPFCKETDSRLDYRTPAESSLYSNREKVRDGLLRLLRQFQQKQHSLIGIENADVAASAIASARELLDEVSPANRWWFAEFFVIELVQVGSNPFGENDKDLAKLAEKNPDRFQKLNRRLSSHKPCNKSPQPRMTSNGGSNNSRKYNTNKAIGKGSNGFQRKNRQDTRADSKEADAIKHFTATFSRMRGFFTDNQLFFFHFLHSCDSYEFSELVKHQLERQFYAILQTSSPSADARKNFTEVVLRLKVVAKFIGYLRFSPQWQVTSSIRQLSADNAAFKAVEREGISTLEVAHDSSLDVKKLLEDSILQSSISKCIPWICDYIAMLSLDRLSCGTTYFKQFMVLLQLLYRSPRLNSLAETGIYVNMQLERIFQMLGLNAGVFRSNDYQSRDLLPSPQVRLALAIKDEVVPDEPVSGGGEDRLPFLYSQVFVQSCVSELDDLRSFIQTRAQPSHHPRRSISSKTMTTDQTTAPIRKLRPLQVVIEDDHTGIPIHPTGMGMVSAVSAPHAQEEPEESDKLSEAVFKVHPKLKKVVEFVVENVTTDVCEHVMAHVVTPRADKLVNRCASETGLLSVGCNAVRSTHNYNSSTARASYSLLITSKTRPKVKSACAVAVQEALRLAEERISAAIPSFMPPSSHPTLTKSIISVAQQRARGAIQALLPKSVQREFVKRLAFRNKSLLKDSNRGIPSAPKEATVDAPASSFESLGNTSEEDSLLFQVEQRYRLLRECGAALSKHTTSIGSNSQSLAKWEIQVSALAQCLQEFSGAFVKCVAARDLTRKTSSPLSISGLVLWDVIWRAVVPCLTFYGFSMDTFVDCALLTMEEAHVRSIERQFTGFIVAFALLLETVVRSIADLRDGLDPSGALRLQSIVAVIMDFVLALPPGVAASPRHDNLIKRFAVQASSHLVAKLLGALASVGGDGNQRHQYELNWDHWKASSTLHVNGAHSAQTQFRLDVWDVAEGLLD